LLFPNGKNWRRLIRNGRTSRSLAFKKSNSMESGALPSCSAVRRETKRMRALIILASLIALGGCTDTADVFPMNTAAQALGSPKILFVRTGVGRGPVTITMADGEVLTGEYRVAFSSAVGTVFAGAASTSAIVIGDGPVQFVAKGPKTQVLCRGSSNTMGHGNGQCQTFEGAVWAISW
jgi:hypothetical protein